MFYDARSDGQLDEKDRKKEIVKLRRDLLGKKDLLRKEELRLNKLEFDERSTIKADDSVKAEILDRENKLKRVADEIRLLEEDVRGKKRVEGRLRDETKNLTRKADNSRSERDNAGKNITRVKSETTRLAGEVKKLESEIKKM